MAKLSLKAGTYIWKGSFEDRLLAKAANFVFKDGGLWISKDKFKALRLIDYADDNALRGLLPLEECVSASLELLKSGISIPAPEGCDYLDFQTAGIEQASKKKISLIADDMGVGKTIQALGIGNYLGLKRTLVIGPASLRIKWKREMLKWQINPMPVVAVMNGKTIVNKETSVVISYNLAVSLYDQLIKQKFDHVIIDECHATKSPEAHRTMAILGNEEKKGLIGIAEKVTLLSGTPIPNRAHEFYPLLSKIAPDVLSPRYLHYGKYLNQFCDWFNGDHGIVVTGSRNEWELYNRLRGTGFMTRRLKKDVLPQLPDKFYNLVVFEADKETRRVIEKEKPFDPNEILKVGASLFPALPEIRREMGEAKVPKISEYIEMLLESTNKVIVGTIHKNVAKALKESFLKYSPAMIIGETPPGKRQFEVDRFQLDEKCRVFIGNLQAAGEGHDLTASSEVVLAEPDWVPLKNEQFIDRSHRIGQIHKVNVHLLVVENSLDAYILGTSVGKQQGINKILDIGA